MHVCQSGAWEWREGCDVLSIVHRESCGTTYRMVRNGCTWCTENRAEQFHRESCVTTTIVLSLQRGLYGTYIHTYVCVSVCICMHVCDTYVCMYVCVCVHIIYPINIINMYTCLCVYVCESTSTLKKGKKCLLFYIKSWYTFIECPSPPSRPVAP